MITIKCTEPVCGKEFQFDDEKNPNAKKTRCPYCKGIVDLTTIESKKNTPIKAEEIVSVPTSIDPISTKVENFNLPPVVNLTPTHVVKSNEESIELQPSGINYKRLVLGGIGLIIVILILFKSCCKPAQTEIKSAYIMPDYKIKFDENIQTEYKLNQFIKINGHIEPAIDSLTKVELTVNNVLLSFLGDSHFELDTSFGSSKDYGNHVFHMKFKGYLRDSLIREDSQIVSINIVSAIKPQIDKPLSNSGIKYESRNLLNLAKSGTWANTEPILFGKNGYVNIESGVTLEDESVKNGVTFSFEKDKRFLYCTTIIDPPAYVNNVYGTLGFHKTDDDRIKNSNIDVEISEYFEGGTSIRLCQLQKVYNTVLLHVDCNSQQKRKTNKFIIKISKKSNDKTLPKLLISY